MTAVQEPIAGTGAAEKWGQTIAVRLHAFRSIGWNCEFGFVQRYCGVEAFRLFRFTFAPIKTLIAVVSSGFER